MVTVRPMTANEYAQWRTTLAEEYANDQVTAGRWPTEGAKRGRGFGRALLAAVEDATRRAGVGSLELNVFGHNRTAVSLYSTSGYEVVTQQMRKRL